MTTSNRRPATGRRVAAIALLGALALGACAALALAQSSAAKPHAQSAGSVPRARAAQPNGGPNGGRNGTQPYYVPADSGPSPQALRVLETIPEPLAQVERVAAPAAPAAADSAAADTAKRAGPADSTAAAADSAAADTASSEAPVPEPTQPMGDTTRTAPTYAEPATTAPATPAAGTGVATPAQPAQPTMPDTCWAVQVASPAEKARAESLREAAESVLLVKMLIEPSKGRFGVRTTGCLTGAAADSLRKRALASGFKDSFRVKWVRAGAGR